MTTHEKSGLKVWLLYDPSFPKGLGIAWDILAGIPLHWHMHATWPQVLSNSLSMHICHILLHILNHLYMSVCHNTTRESWVSGYHHHFSSYGYHLRKSSPFMQRWLYALMHNELQTAISSFPSSYLTLLLWKYQHSACSLNGSLPLAQRKSSSITSFTSTMKLEQTSSRGKPSSGLEWPGILSVTNLSPLLHLYTDTSGRLGYSAYLNDKWFDHS